MEREHQKITTDKIKILFWGEEHPREKKSYQLFVIGY